MGFIDFLKKLTRRNRIEEPANQIEKLAFDEIENWVESKKKEIENKKRKFFTLNKTRILQAIKELNEKLEVLEKIDIESKKVEEKIKLVVGQNLSNYTYYVKNLIEKLNNLEEEDTEKFVENINTFLLDFDKKSNMSYHKVTFLIGKEVATIRESIVEFSKDIEKIFTENKDIVNHSKILSFIKLKLSQIAETNETASVIDKEVEFLNKKIKELNEANNKTSEEIKEIKKTKSYAENLEKQEEIKSAEAQLEIDFYKLKEIIDFRSLGNIFHTDKKKISIIKIHKENFQETFQKDTEVSILSLLNEAKLNNKEISTKIKQINEKTEKLTQKKETIKKDQAQELLSGIKETNLEIEKLNTEKTRELKKFEKLKISKNELIDSITQEISKLNVVITNV